MNTAFFAAGAAFLYCANVFAELGASLRLRAMAVAAFFVAALLFLNAIHPGGFK